MSKLSCLFSVSALKSFGTQTENGVKYNRWHKPWFNLKCKTARKKYHLTKRIQEKLRSQDTKAAYKFASKHYKNTLDVSYKQYRKDLSKKLKTLRTKILKEYWKILNHSRTPSKNSADINDIFNFFRRGPTRGKFISLFIFSFY
jgi:hypothetical protein